MKENKSKYAILGILSMGPKSGYDIKQMFEKIASNFWNESYGQIYPILKRLSSQGLATKSVEKQVGRPDRHVYALTKKGREALKLWLVEPVGRQIGRHEILLKLFFGREVSLADHMRQIEHFRDLHQGELQNLKAVEERLKSEHGDDPGLPYWLMTVSYGKHVNRATLRWCKESLSALGRMAGGTEKGPHGRKTN
jgi:PadR family transcriptional regulator AphA